MNNANIQNNMQVLNIPIEDIIPNRFQPRLSFDEAGLRELASSIKEHGIIQPLVLRRLQDKYEIIAGERRYKAAKMAGLTSVPAIISEMDDKKSAEVAIVENVQRRDLSSIEEAKSYKTLLDKGYLTQEELAKKMGLSQSAISNKLRLLSLSPSVQEALIEGKISERHARSLLVLERKEDQDEWLQKLINERLTVKELDKKLESFKKKIGEEDIPIIEISPNIEEIKEKATDINAFNNIEPIEVMQEEKQENKIPNTFFNFLENEQANMSSISESVDDDIELLDFVAPSDPLDEIEENNKKDMNKANSLIEEVNNSLKENGYKVNIEKDENENNIKYIITIDKN